MNAELYLSYSDYNDDGFQIKDNPYGSEDDYTNKITEEYNKTKDIVYNSVLDAKNGVRGTLLGADGQTYKFGTKVSTNADKVAYTKCNGTLYNENGELETVDGIIDRFAQQKTFIEMIELDLDSIEGEFETDFLMWIKEHKSIDGYKRKLGEEWCWIHEPIKDLRLVFKNKANQDVYAVFENCKVMDVVDEKTFIFFIEKMTLIDKFV
jgi:hypothetical protein